MRRNKTITYQFPIKVLSSLDVSEQTLKDYNYRIPLFIRFSKDEIWDREILLRYKRYLAGISKYSISTKNKYLATAKLFVKQLFRKGFIPNDISQTTKSFPQIKKHKKVGFTENEVVRITEYLMSLDNSKPNVRRKALIALMLFQGLRQIEIVRLTVEDLNLNTGTAMVQSKGSLDKEMIYLHPETIKVLKQLLKEWKLSSGYVFVGEKGNPIS